MSSDMREPAVAGTFYPSSSDALRRQVAEMIVIGGGLTNIGSPLLDPMLAAMRERGIPIATDVHAIADLDSDYDRAFMAAADILFMCFQLQAATSICRILLSKTATEPVWIFREPTMLR